MRILNTVNSIDYINNLKKANPEVYDFFINMSKGRALELKLWARSGG
ncbi:MAG TPA: hypothetical protein PLR73_03210 [Acetivibrio sp.]|nr:hypothetical protein [Acetivibrio sp.]